jgi:hypothetical protein
VIEFRYIFWIKPVKFITVALAGLVVSTLLWSESVNSQSRRSRDVSVDGYYRRNGTYVAPYIRTAPNQTRDDNYSTRGNINPYTLEEGKQRGGSETPRYGYETPTPTTYSYPSFEPSFQPSITMPNVIKEYQYALDIAPPLKVNIAPAFTPPPDAQDPAQPPTPIIPASNFPSAPKQARPLPEQPQIQPTPSSLLQTPPTPTGETALSYGETVSRLSAQSTQDIRKILDSSGTPKPNDVQKLLLDSRTPVQIDPKQSSQNNPFVLSSKPANVAERFAFEPPVLANLIFSTACFGVFTTIIFVFLNRDK